MNQPLICMTVTGKTLEENAKIVRKYEKQIDLVELRVDHLNEDEQFYIRRFPSMIRQPCILSIRRDIDGGAFTGGEFSRTNLFARALAFANENKKRNFAYVDFEDDYNCPSIQDASQAFGVRIIRSYHNLNEPVKNVKERCDIMRKTGYEIPKVVFKPRSITDVLNLFKESEHMTQYDHIISAVGIIGQPSRILASRTNSFLTYVSPEEMLENTVDLGHLSPELMADTFNFRSINNDTKLFGVTGWPFEKFYTLDIFNKGFENVGLNALYLPLRSNLISDVLNFAEQEDFRGLSITIPFKESVLYYLDEQSPEVLQIGACNTVVRRGNKWIGYNTDYSGFKSALEDFLGPVKIKRKKVAVIGAGSAAKAVAYTLKLMGAKVCIFNRTEERAEQLAGRYGFDYCQLDVNCAPKLDEYSNLIINTSTLGNEGEVVATPDNDPIYFYNFRGNELVFDLVFSQAITPMMRRASLAGCRTCNGQKMLENQAREQFRLFTSLNYINK